MNENGMVPSSTPASKMDEIRPLTIGHNKVDSTAKQATHQNQSEYYSLVQPSVQLKC